MVRALAASKVRTALVDDVYRMARLVSRAVGANDHRVDKRLNVAAVNWDAVSDGRRVARRVPMIVCS